MLIQATVTEGLLAPEDDTKTLYPASADAGATAVVAVEPITLQQAKEHLRVVVADDDAYISGLIVAARVAAEGRLNRTIVQRQRVARFAAWTDDMVLLKPPILSVDSVMYVDETGGEMPLDLGLYYLQPADEDTLPRLELRAGEPYPLLDRRRQPIAVHYTAGYAVGEVPPPIIQWMLLAIGTLYGNRESIINGSISQELAGDFVKYLLQPHMVYE